MKLSAWSCPPRDQQDDGGFNGAGRRLSEADVEHDHHVLSVIDLIQHPPAAAQAGAVDAGQLRAERLADPPRIIEEGSGEELGRRGGDLDGQPFAEGPPGRGRGPQLVAGGHEAWRPFSRSRTASVP
jgi:hypothetical protein